MMYQYKNKKHKDKLTACYFLQHPKETKVTEQDLNNWLLWLIKPRGNLIAKEQEKNEDRTGRYVAE